MIKPNSTKKIIRAAESDLKDRFALVDEIAAQNQKRVLNAFRTHRLSPEYFAERTGYGMDDAAREVLDNVYAEVFAGEAAAVRMQMVSGTHALACALFGNLSSGDRLVVLTGHPYDTMEKVIGIRGNVAGSLIASGVRYSQIDLIGLLTDEPALKEAIAAAVKAPCRLVYIQKSCGYSIDRRTLRNEDIALICSLAKEANPECLVMVDNCYGEYVEQSEPLSHGADIVAGSLIKNPGGGLAISGGYVAGKQTLVDSAMNRLTAPGIGGHLGLSFNQNRLLFQGMFLAPSVVSSAIKGAHLFARVFAELGFEVFPQWNESRGDIIQAIKFGERQPLVNFLKALQHFSPVDAHVIPEPADMPGYEDKVVMAGGTFIEGSTIELSGDGPLRPPYAAFVQGGLTYLHVRIALEGLLELGHSVEYRFLPG
jgi:cystathionine beta-lyase family protein involved in aluminum resistance